MIYQNPGCKLIQREFNYVTYALMIACSRSPWNNEISCNIPKRILNSDNTNIWKYEKMFSINV